MPNDLSTFDPDTFLNTEYDGANETRFQPYPESDYEAMVDKVAIRVQDEYTILEVMWQLLDPALSEAMGMDRIICRQSVFLDIEGGVIALGPNKNVQLGRLRDALHQNESGRPWSPRMLEGAGPALVHVNAKPDKNDPSIIRNNVVRVAPLA